MPSMLERVASNDSFNEGAARPAKRELSKNEIMRRNPARQKDKRSQVSVFAKGSIIRAHSAALGACEVRARRVCVVSLNEQRNGES